jgi:hypothetical protein
MTILAPIALALLLGSPSYAARESATASLLALPAPYAVPVVRSLGPASPDAEVRWRAGAILRAHAARGDACWACGGTGWDAARFDPEIAEMMRGVGRGEVSGVPCERRRGRGKASE